MVQIGMFIVVAEPLNVATTQTGAGPFKVVIEVLS